MVSTLTRRDNRVQPRGPRFSDRNKSMFQPSPGVITGCNRIDDCAHRQIFMFQPSPGVITGCNSSGDSESTFSLMFQPSPGVITGCNSFGSVPRALA